VPANTVRATRCAVPLRAQELVADERFDYADAFAVTVPLADRLSAERWARVMFTPRTRAERVFVVAWSAATGVQSPRAAPRTSAFRMVSPGSGSAVLIGDSARYRIRLVVLVGDGRVTLATFVKSQGIAWRQLLRPVMVAHRRVAPRLLEVAVKRTLASATTNPAPHTPSQTRAG
jgi:hypothetical protein